VGAEYTIHAIEVFLGIGIGSVTFTGSVIAFLKLQGMVSGKPLLLPARHALNVLLLVITFALLWPFLAAEHGTATGTWVLVLATVLTGILGVHLVMAIGGADMPVVVSMLNSYSGWAAAAAGFMLDNDLLIITGALVGSSGAILSYIMCRGMNRSFVSVILGGFGTGEGGTAGDIEGEYTEIDVAGTVDVLKHAKSVVIVPGYGMAVAQAQHSVRDLANLLESRGVEVSFAIHPVAGRMPGHMNVLLAEADVPYDQVFEMDDVNPDLPETDVVLVLGANDIVNPDALDKPGSPIYGMPILEVFRAGTVIVVKRSMSPGFSGIDNPLYYRDNTMMVFGDARAVVEAMVKELKGAPTHA
jgi:NAD(P) transhydrogenase subunit beta